MFCSRCGALVIPTRSSSGETVFKCAACGQSQSSKTGEDYTIEHKISHSDRDMTVVLESLNELDQLPTAKVGCPKCGHSQASYWQSQVQADDEAPTLFYRCRRCGLTFREHA